jgi:hypothetical protein
MGCTSNFNIQAISLLIVDPFYVETQVLERNTLSIDIYSRDTFIQKLNHIHRNPVYER